MNTAPILTTKDIRALRAQCHHLKPVVLLGHKSLTRSVLEEIDKMLFAHQLIKIKLNGHDKAKIKKVIEIICEKLCCCLVQKIGMTIALFKEKTEETYEERKKSLRRLLTEYTEESLDDNVSSLDDDLSYENL